MLALFAGAALASTAVFVLAALSQVVLLCVAGGRLHGYSGVHWSPQMWWAMRDTPVSLAAALVVFVSVFFWQYHRSIRPATVTQGYFVNCLNIALTLIERTSAIRVE